MDPYERINRQLFSRERSRKLQFRLLWLVLALGIAPAAIWITYRSAPEFVEGADAFVPSHLTKKPDSEGDLFTDSVGAIVLLSLLSGVTAFVLMWAYGDERIVAVTVVSAALALAVIACVLLAGGNGIVTPKGAQGKDLFVVYCLPACIAVAIGASMGSAVANRR